MKPAPALERQGHAAASPPARGQPSPRTPPLAAVPQTTTKPPTLVEEFLDTQDSSSHPSIISALRRAATALGTTLDEIRWELVRHHQVEEVRNFLYHKRRLEATTVNTTLSAVKGVARKAWHKGLMTHEDYALIKDVPGLKNKRARRGRVVTVEELAAINASCREDPNAARGARDWAVIAGLLMGAGLRRAEAASVDLKHLDRSDFTLRVRGKGRNERTAYIQDPGARQAIVDWLDVRGKRRGALLYRVHRSGEIIEERLDGQTIYDLVRARATAAGVAHFSPHDLRRTFATEIIKKTRDIRTAQLILGHSDIGTTTRYDMRKEDELRQASRLDYVPTRHPGSRRKPHRGRRRRRAPTPGIKASKKLLRMGAQVWAAKDDDGGGRDLN